MASPQVAGLAALLYGALGGNRSSANAQLIRNASAKEQIYEILHVIFKRWRWIAVLFFLVAVPGIVLTALEGKRFAAKAFNVSSSLPMATPPPMYSNGRFA